MTKLVISDKKKNVERQNLVELEYNSILQNIDEGYAFLKILFDEKNNPDDFIFLSANSIFNHILNINKVNLVGRNFSEVLPFYETNLIELYKSSVLSDESKIFEYYSAMHDRYYKISITPVDKKQIITIVTEITESRKSSIKVERLIKILKAIRQIKELIVKENVEDDLLNKTCKILVKSAGYSLVRITLLTETNEIKKSYCSDKSTDSLNQYFDYLFPCIKKLIYSKKHEVYIDPKKQCNKCLLKSYSNDQPHLIVPMVYNNFLYGAITIVLHKKYVSNNDENLLFEELGEDLAYALFNMDVQHDLTVAREKIQQFYKEIESQNSKLKTINEALEFKNRMLLKANERALESDRLKSVFLANISHEIRTPLNGILGFSQLLTKSISDTYIKKEYSDLIASCGDDLLQIVNNVLDISKIETRQLRLNYSECKVSDILKDAFNNNVNNIADNEKIIFEIDQIEIKDHNNNWCDGKKIYQVLNLLIKNSIKFTETGFIRIGCREKNEKELLFYVSDSGIGIKEEYFDLIFERFRQSDESDIRKYGGAGLGLAIAKGIVSIMNGKIWVESKLGVGTTFYFTIPYQINKNNDNLIKEMDIDKIDLINWGNKKILIVEDDIYSIEYLTELLSETKAKIETAKNGNDALRIIKENKDFSLILMDIQIPGISGDKVASLIREFNQEIPIIAQTAHAMIKDKENYIKAGCTDYISKPINISELFSIISKYI